MLDAGCAFASASDCIKIWDANADRLHLNTHYTTEGFAGSSSFKDVSWSVNNTRLACISNGNGIILYNFQEGVKNEGRELLKSKEQTALCFGSTKDELYSGGATGDINQWNCNTFELVKTFSNKHGSAVRRLAKLGDKIVSASTTGDLYLWQTSTSSILTKFTPAKPKSIRGLEYSRYDKTMLSTASDDGEVSIWDVEKETIRHTFSSHNAPAMDLSFSTINALLMVSGGLDKKIIFYDAQAKNIVKTITSVQPITSVCFLGNGMHVCAGTSVGNILLYDLRNNSEPLTNLHAHSTSVQRLVLQTLKEKKRSSRSSSRTSDKKAPRIRQESTTKQLTIQPSDQQHLTRKPEDTTSHKRSSPRIVELDNNSENLKSAAMKTPQVSLQEKPNKNILSRELQTPQRSLLSDRDTLGSYCEQLFSPLGSIDNSIQNESIQHHTKSRQPLSINKSRQNTPISHSTSTSQNVTKHLPNDTGVNGLHTPSAGNHDAINTVGDTNLIQHEPVSSSTPANAVFKPNLSQHHYESAPPPNIPVLTSPMGAQVSGIQGSSQPVVNNSQASLTFQYQLDFLKNTVYDLVQDHEENVRDELRHLHLQIIKMFAEQNEVIKQLAEQCSVNPLLLQEIERLRDENDRLRRKF